MDFGTNCHLSTCLHLSFLPLSCPYCHQEFCESHFLPRQHRCEAPGSQDNVLSENEVAKRILRVNASSRTGEGRGAGRLPCQRRGCKGFSLEVGSSSSSSSSSSNNMNTNISGGPAAAERIRIVVKDGKEIQGQGRAFEHTAPSCINCRGLYCASHVTPRAHDCQAAPPRTSGQQRMDAAEERKRKAREILSKNFANRAQPGSAGIVKK